MTKELEAGKKGSAKPTQSPPAAKLPTRSQVEQVRIEAVADKCAARSAGPPMKLKMADGVVQITFTHADPDLAHILLMADLGTCDPDFMAGVQGQVASICLRDQGRSMSS